MEVREVFLVLVSGVVFPEHGENAGTTVTLSVIRSITTFAFMSAPAEWNAGCDWSIISVALDSPARWWQPWGFFFLLLSSSQSSARWFHACESPRFWARFSTGSTLVHSPSWLWYLVSGQGCSDRLDHGRSGPVERGCCHSFQDQFDLPHPSRRDGWLPGAGTPGLARPITQ